jgi:hypothetical protein
MRKPNELKTVLNRIETLARKEYRDIVGQLEMMLDVYEKRQGVSSKRPYTRTELKSTEGKPPSKPRKKSKTMTSQGRKNISMGMKLSWARRKLAATNPTS